MNILVLGGCGYIGSHLCQLLRQQYWTDSLDLEWFGGVTPNNVKGDFSKLSKSFFEPYEAVVLVAAHSSVPMCNYDKIGAFRNNVANFVELAGKLTRQKLIYAGSSCVYVSTGDRPATEDEPLCPVDVLSFTKTAIDHYARLTDVQYYSLRFGSVNGWSPNFRPDLMINSMTGRALAGDEVHVSNGRSHRPILGMRDLGRAVLAVVECQDDRRGVYNVSSFNARIEEIAGAVSAATGAAVVPDPDTKTYDFSIDCSKFTKEFGFVFEDTVESIVESIRVNKDNLKTAGRKRDAIYE